MRNFDFPVTILLKATCRRKKNRTKSSHSLVFYKIKINWSSCFKKEQDRILIHSTKNRVKKWLMHCHNGAVRITLPWKSPNKKSSFFFYLVLNVTVLFSTSLGYSSFTFTKANIRPLTAHFWTILTHHSAPRYPRSNSWIHQ